MNLVTVIFALLIAVSLLAVIPAILSHLFNYMEISTEARADNIAGEFSEAIERGTVQIEPFSLDPDQFAIQLHFSEECIPFMNELYTEGVVLQGSPFGSECPGNVCFCIGTFKYVDCEGLETCSPNPYSSERCTGRTCVLNWYEQAPSWVPILESEMQNVTERGKVVYKSSSDPLSTLSSLCVAFFRGAYGLRPEIVRINCGRIGDPGSGSYISVDDGQCSGSCGNNVFLWVRPNSQLGKSGATGIGGVAKTTFEVIR